VKKGAAVCPACGSALSRKEKGGPGTDRGLKLAIGAVAVLWCITAGLWMLWPRLSPAAPALNEDANAILSGGLSHTLDFVPSPAPSPEALPMQQPSPSPAPTSDAARLKLAPDTWWQGRLTLSNYEGEDPPVVSDLEVWGYIGQEADGRSYFGVYFEQGATDQDAALIFYYIDLSEDSFVPVITHRSGFVLARSLDPRDEAPLSLRLEDGKLDLEYHYVTSVESCDVSCVLVPAP
jgi:hypothetical protein